MSLRSEISLAFDRAPPRVASTFAHEILAFDKTSMRTFDIDGRLHVENCNISKATVNPYYGREIPNADALGLDPDKIYKLYRDPVELAKAASTFARLQLLDLHTAVDAENPKLTDTCGTIGSDVRFESPHLKASLAIWTADSIQRILAKKTAQLSCSYRYTAVMESGTSHDGLTYDGRMVDLIGNHVALVKEGRAGPDVCVNDELPIGFKNMFKFPALISTIAKVVTGMTESQKLALDAAFEKEAKDGDPEEAMDAREAACDSREEAMDEKDTDEKAKGDRKSARDKRASDRAKRASDRKAKDGNWGLGTIKKGADGEPEDKKVEKAADANTVTLAQAQAMASDAATSAVARVTAIETARRDVAPLVGAIVVAMDSAESVYRFALDQAKVNHKDVPAAALSHIVAAEVRSRKSAATPANDAVSVPSEFTLDSIFTASK